jgi:hypothetical protein
MPSSGIVNSVIRITGIGDHDRPEWLIRISGMRNDGAVKAPGIIIERSGGPRIRRIIVRALSHGRF